MPNKQTPSAKNARVLEECFEKIFRTKRWGELSHNYPRITSVKLKYCKMVDEERGDKKTKEQKRSYAHTYHKSDVICISRDFFKLPMKHQRGILYHEIGHILTPGGDEHDADKFMFDNFKIEIKYDNSLELQYV